MVNFKIINVGKRQHVVCDARSRGAMPDPNYQGSKMALCGVIEKGKTLEEWKKKHRK